MIMKKEQRLEEQVLGAWISLNGLLKDSLMTQGLTYNEAIVMNLVYNNHQKGEKETSTQELIAATGFLKSLMNRTINSLCQQGFLEKHKDGRNLFVSIIEAKLPDFLKVHEHSLSLTHDIIKIIGTDDAQCFVSLCEKLLASPIREQLKD